MRPIIPEDCIDYQRSERELHMFWLFCLLTAGKNASWAAEKAFRMCEAFPTPFFLSTHELLVYRSPLACMDYLRGWNTGQYIRLGHALSQTMRLINDAHVPLGMASLDTLMVIRGVGPKTARMFCLFSREQCEPMVILDVHVLRWLRWRASYNLPEITPPEPRYSRVEAFALSFLRGEYAGRWGEDTTWAQVNLDIWKEQARGIA